MVTFCSLAMSLWIAILLSESGEPQLDSFVDSFIGGNDDWAFKSVSLSSIENDDNNTLSSSDTRFGAKLAVEEEWR